jgi:hypothetical protein
VIQIRPTLNDLAYIGLPLALGPDRQGKQMSNGSRAGSRLGSRPSAAPVEALDWNAGQLCLDDTMKAAAMDR